MEPFHLLKDIAIIAIVSVIVVLLLERWKISIIAGLLAAGIVVGPFGFHLVRETHVIEILAEVGVVLLLFSIGLEFSLTRLKRIFRYVMFGGAVQVLLTALLTMGIALLFNLKIQQAIFWGFVFAMSSTAIVLRLLMERGEIDAPHGRFIVGVLIFQDLCVVPMMLIIPVLAGHGSGNISLELAMALGKALLVLALTILFTRYIIPRLFSRVDATRSREVFLLTVIGICLGSAWLTSLSGLSLALGAFLAGIMLADTDYRHRALTELLPLRDTFTSLFFISLGMLFDGRFLFNKPLVILGLLTAFIFGKAMVASISALVMRFPPRAIWLAGIGLAQFGEFAFVLLRSAKEYGLLGDAEIQAPLVSGILSMILTPFLIRIAPRLTAGEKLLAPLANLLGARSIDEVETNKLEHKNHIVVIGYGPSGQMLTKILSDLRTQFLVFEMNAATVREHQQKGIPIYYADATSTEALEHAHLNDAQALVIMINDPQAARRIVDSAKHIAPNVPIFIRIHYRANFNEFISLGATDVVCEEFEAGLEIAARVMRHLSVPRNIIDEQIYNAREAPQKSARKIEVTRAPIDQVEALADLKVESFLVRESSQAKGQSALSLQIRSKTGALIVAIQRQGKLIEYTKPELLFEPNDVLFLIGSRDAVGRALLLLEKPSKNSID